MAASQPIANRRTRHPSRRVFVVAAAVVVVAAIVTTVVIATTLVSDDEPALTIEELLEGQTGMPEGVAGRAEILNAEATAAAANLPDPGDELRAVLQPFFESNSFHIEGDYFNPDRRVEIGTYTNSAGRQVPYSLGGQIVELLGDYAAPDSFRLTRNILGSTVLMPDGTTVDVPDSTEDAVIRNGTNETPGALTIGALVAQEPGAVDPRLFLVELLAQSLRGQGSSMTVEEFLAFDAVTRLTRMGRGFSVLQGYEATHPLLVSRATWEFWFDVDTQQLAMVRFAAAREVGTGSGLGASGEITLSRRNRPIPDFP